MNRCFFLQLRGILTLSLKHESDKTMKTSMHFKNLKIYLEEETWKNLMRMPTFAFYYIFFK